jgi:hypothetical protein
MLCFSINTHIKGLKWNRNTAPLIPEISNKSGVPIKLARICWILKDRIVVELRPMDVLSIGNEISQ